jgi:hypothetical protein
MGRFGLRYEDGQTVNEHFHFAAVGDFSVKNLTAQSPFLKKTNTEKEFYETLIKLGETEDLHLSPAAALAGKVYGTLMSQITAGKKHGGINEVENVVFKLKKSEISQLDTLGLIPMVNEYGKVMAFSGKTLFNGENLGLQTYSVVRVFDYIMKVLFDFLNRRAFENWSGKTERDLRGEIIKFLDSIQGADRLIEKFKIVRFERDPVSKDRIFLDLFITPYFPAKSFVIKLDGTKGEDETTWNGSVEQQ